MYVMNGKVNMVVVGVKVSMYLYYNFIKIILFSY